MTKAVIDELVKDFSAGATTNADPELRAVEAALFIEECFGIRLSDGDFTDDKLGSPDAVRKFLNERLGA